ncbi:uncharacterized protein LOC117513998 [Thalassophryne amazonica]|uniref:uncharacterized protein LOC117513998 n=1 Tax=Thalassophryne amazonica TaxID=390379 RepID=UPI0014717BB9|nr:uncharacterized protein LOC117513998 [Thalassophryne amazonica]XP_034030170.1 uncharacterized protein LOC117513998 [Thalassophryne amazonica]XP_034030171.1 uncharacterized protein LOC117513998 [Thalassophryne amazonica]
MDYTAGKGEMAEGGMPEPLIITEEEDITEAVSERWSDSNLDVIMQSNLRQSDPIKEDVCAGSADGDTNLVSKLCLEEQNPQNPAGAFTEDGAGKQEETETVTGGQHTDEHKSGEQVHNVMRIEEQSEKISVTCAEKFTPAPLPADVKGFNFTEERREGVPNDQDDPKKAHRLTPDFPEALYELLCTLQEGRRFNDQRCSFRMESGVRRRRCHSEPNTNKPTNRVIFSSMTSLQTEEFFELVATAQARRLDDQRAQLGTSAPPKRKSRSFRGSLKQLSIVKKPAPVPVPTEDLYNMIRITQAQGRMEDQRSRAPGPMDDEDFFSLLLRVQGGRMDEQRTEFPQMLKT